MADIDNFDISWQGLTHGQVEDAIKAKAALLDAAIATGVTDRATLSGLISALRTDVNGLIASYPASKVSISGYTSLLEKLSEMDDLIEQAGQSGAPVDLSNYYTIAQVNNALSGKQNLISDLSTIRSGAAAGATSVQSISVNGTPQQMGQNGNVNIQVQGGGESIVFDTEGTPIADGTLSQNADSVLAAASARWVKEIDSNVKAILAALANIAFTNGKPTWAAVSKRTYSLTMSLSGCSGEVVSGSDGNGQVYEGGVQIKLTPTIGYTFTSVMVNSVNVQTTPTGLSDGSVYVDFIANQDMKVSATAVSGFAIAVSGAHVTNSQTHSGSTYTVTLGSDNQHFQLPATIVVKHGSTVLTAGTDYTYNQSTGAVVINNVTDNTFSIEVEMVEDTKYTVTIDATGLTGATATPASQQVYAGENAVITVVPSVSGYSLDSVKYTVNGGSEQTATISNNQAIITISNVQATTSVVITGSASVPSVSIQHTETNCSLTMPQGTIGVGDNVTIPITAAAGYGIKDACISVKNADTSQDIEFELTQQESYDNSYVFNSKVNAELKFSASCTNIVVVVNAAMLLLKGHLLTGATNGTPGVTTSNASALCTLLPKVHINNGSILENCTVNYKYANKSDYYAKIVFMKASSETIRNEYSQSGSTAGMKPITIAAPADPYNDEVRASFVMANISICYVSVTPNGGTETKAIEFDDESKYMWIEKPAS